MAQELQTAHHRLEFALDQWQLWRTRISQRPQIVRKLDSKSNDAFLVSVENKSFVVRINNPNQSLGVNRDDEIQILTEIRKSGFTADLIWHHPSALVTSYIGGVHPARPADQESLASMGQLFASIHATTTHVDSTLDPRRRALDYYNKLSSPDPIISRSIELLLSGPTATFDQICLCHNDLLFENVLMRDDNWYAIDWEYGAKGDPAFDIAVFLEDVGANEEETKILVGAYGQDHILPRLNYYRDFYRLIEVLWWHLRSPNHQDNVRRVSALGQRLGIS